MRKDFSDSSSLILNIDDASRSTKRAMPDPRPKFSDLQFSMQMLLGDLSDIKL